MVSAPPLRDEAAKRAELAQAKRRATSLLVALGVAFVVLVAVAPDGGATEWALAFVEAGLVGGLADWFAVTAVFRHPLGLPIPHTAVIAERKDAFGATLAGFVQQNFLSAEVVGDRIESARVVERAGTWLSEPANAARLAGHAADLLVGAVDAMNDADGHALVHEQITRAVEAVPVAPLAGRMVGLLTTDGRHQELLTAVLHGLEKTLDEQRVTLRDRFAQESPWWLPNAAEDRVFTRLYDGLRAVLAEVAADPDHDLRQRFETWITELGPRLETSPELAQRGDDLKRSLLAHPELRVWSASLWADAKAMLRTQAGDPGSELRTRLAEALAAAGRRMATDPVLAAKGNDVLRSGLTYAADHFADEISSLVSGTIARWDAAETSDKLELLLGRDLQFIRINGSIVGGVAGLIIHAVQVLAGS